MDRRSRHNMSKPGSVRNSHAGSMVGGSLSHARFSKSFLGSKSSLLSSSKKNLASESTKFSKPGAQIVDEHGNDVTPLSLLEPEHVNLFKRNQSNFYGGDNGSVTDSLFQHSIYGAGPSSKSFSQPFSRSVFSSSTTDLGIRDSTSEELISAIPTSKQEQEQTLPGQPEEQPAKQVEVDLDSDVTITLSETETIWMLDIPGIYVAEDSTEMEIVNKQNEDYTKLVECRAGNDRYSERGMQTINNDVKIKQNQTDDVVKKDAGTIATTWEMYDTYESLKQTESGEGTEKEETLEELSTRATSRVLSGTSNLAPTVMNTPSTMTSTVPGESVFMASMITEASVGMPQTTFRFVGDKGKEEDTFDPTKANNHPLLKNETLMDSFRIVERAVTQNIFQPKQALYRKLPVLATIPSSKLDSVQLTTPHLEKLWSFACPLTKRLSVTSMAWNQLNLDIVAVGYCDFSSKGSTSGVICCWSLKNPLHPERVFTSPSGVTSVCFSKKYPNLLAAGLYNGSVVLFNVRSTAHESVLDSRDALHKHSAPVWQVGWVTKERVVGENKAENLVSISVDGKVLQWSIRKGFESTQLMKLKRMVKPKQQQNKDKIKPKKAPIRVKPTVPTRNRQTEQANAGGEAYISQHAPGLGFDFSPKDSNIYLACTEEGFIHKCSCSYNEQVLETYTGHNGPVCRVCWSPFVPTLFLSCSADWSVKLWTQDSTTPLHSFHTTAQKSISDVCWSPLDSRMFACVSEGRIEVWNLEHSLLDPLILHKPISGVQQTSIAFAPNTQVVLVGDEMGEVSVYLIKNILAPSSDQEEALLRSVFDSRKELSN